jgi:phenylacetate-CoA ligase
LPETATTVDSTDLFLRLPHPARQGIVAGVGLRNRLQRYGPTYRRMVAQLSDSETWTRERLDRFQSRLLLELLVEARRGTDFYRQTLASFTDSDLAGLATELDLGSLPLLDKSTLKQETGSFDNRLRRSVSRSSTSGSTGSPLEVRYDRESIQISFAFLHRHRIWLGLGPWPRAIRMSGRQILPSSVTRPPFWLANPLERQLLISTYHLRPDSLGPIVGRIRRFAPTVIEGYPSAIRALGEGVVQHGGLPTVQAIMTTAETVTPDIRESIQEAFAAPIYDYYSASEGAPFIQQCERGGLHMRPESGVFEVLDSEGNPVPPGLPGELVVTSFRQWKTPLIRYRTGDSIVLPQSDSDCPCGRSLPLVQEILGRREDLVQTPDGRAIGMFAYRTLKHVAGLTEAQIVQTAPTSFRVNAILDGSCGRSDVRSNLAEVFTRVLGFRPNVELVACTTIPRGPSGKFRAVVRAFDGHSPPIDPASHPPNHG